MPTSGDDLHIDPHDAQRIAHRLAEFEHRISSLRSRLEKYGRNTLGTQGLDDACDDFQDRWDDGLIRLKKAAGAISGNFDKAMREYASTDIDVRHHVNTVQTGKPSHSKQP
jgi:hypothetical protein